MDDDLSLDEESEQEEKFVEKGFNFVSEISILVDYTVISQYMSIVKNKEYKKSPGLLNKVKILFNRILHQIKAAWIFFQFEYMLIIQDFINKGVVNNSLMKGILPTGGNSLIASERAIEYEEEQLKSTFTLILRQFLDVYQKNRLLGVECLFRFSSREHKDSILTNYESMGPAATTVETQKQAADDDFEEQEYVVAPHDQSSKHKNGKGEGESLRKVWTQEQDNTLIDNYEPFKELGNKRCFTYIA